MLGFSTESSVLVSVASLLYGIALAALGGRVVLRKYPPNRETQALLFAAASLAVIASVYGALNAVFWLLHLPGGFGG
jgi:hypothetical protein